MHPEVSYQSEDPSFQPEEVTPVASPRCLTPRPTSPDTTADNTLNTVSPHQQGTHSSDPGILNLSTSPVMRESSCQYSSDDLDESEAVIQEASSNSIHVSLSDANCQTSIVFDETNVSSRDTSTEGTESDRTKSMEETSVQCCDTDIMLSFQQDPRSEEVSTGDDAECHQVESYDVKKDRSLSECNKSLDLSNMFDSNKQDPVNQMHPETHSPVISETLFEKEGVGNQLSTPRTDDCSRLSRAADPFVSPAPCGQSGTEQVQSVTQKEDALPTNLADKSAKRKILNNLTNGNLLVRNF